MTHPTRATTVAVVALAPVAGIVAFAAARGDRRAVAYVVVWSVLAAAVRAVHRRAPLPIATVVALGVSGAVHVAGGLLPSPDPAAPILYETWLIEGVVKFDQVAHAAISAVVTVAVFQALAHVLDPGRAGAPVRAALATVVCWGFGAANELFEFLSALRFEDSYAGDLTNAGWDLAYNTVGSVTAAVVLVVVAGERGDAAVSAGS